MDPGFALYASPELAQDSRMNAPCPQPRFVLPRCLAPWTLAAVIMGSLLPLRAEDITTLSGKRFSQARAAAVESGHVLIQHAGGRERIAWTDLSPETQLLLLKQSVEELDKLKGELNVTQKEATTLKKTSEQFRQNLIALGEDPTALNKPITPAAGLPPVDKNTVIAAQDIAAHYHADVGSADARYRKKVFRLEGTVERLDKDMFLRTYEALLKVPGKSVRVLCVIKPPEAYTKVYATRNGERMVAEGERLGKVTLMQAGDKLVFEGKCTGFKDSTVNFDVIRILP